jgi:hypothetical protein
MKVDAEAVIAQISAKTAARVRSYFESRDDWNLSRSLKNLIEQAIHDYEHRAVVELIQNAHDAHPPGARHGRVLVRLDHDEGPHGTLTVANTGLPFSSSNFEAICDVAQSDKRADEGIGNKGIGFKSTLQLCGIPEVYSSSSSESTTFDGYCFRFADEEDLSAAVGGDHTKAADLARDVFHLCLPVPIHDIPSTIGPLRAEGYVTAIRLPLKSQAALEEAMDEVAGIRRRPPTLLFLRRVAELIIEERREGVVEHHVLERREQLVGSVDARSTLTEVTLGDEGRYLVAERIVESADFHEAIAQSVESNRINEGWSDWKTEARVGIGLSLDESISTGRLYTFLPMGEHAQAPLPAHVNAPFFAKLARVDFEASVPLNDFLLDEVASLAAAVVLGATMGTVTVAPTVVGDLLSWNSPHHQRLERAYERSGQSLSTAPVVPLRDGKWGTLTNSLAWDDEGLTVLTAPAIQRAASADLLHDSIAGDRLDRLSELAEVVSNSSMFPDDAAIAQWAEALALRSAKRKTFVPRWWEAFYDELSSVIDRPAALSGRRILVDDDCTLQRCAGPDEDKGPSPFFSPKADDDGDGGSIDLRIPRTLKSQIVFVNQQLRWTERKGTTSRRPGRHMLDQLVHEYRASELFGVLHRSLSRRPSPPRSRDALEWAYRFVRSRDDPPWAEISKVAFHVPTIDGRWIPAREAIFSKAWGAIDDKALDEFMTRAEGLSPALDSLRLSLIPDPEDWPFRVDDQQAFRNFLERLGVRSGLWPRRIARSRLSDDGHRFEEVSAYTAVSLPETTSEQWRSALQRQVPRGLRPYTKYQAVGPQYALPGQAEYGQFDDELRRLFAQLIVLGLDRWDDRMLTVELHRYNDAADRFSWPTPATAFLEEVEWLPMAKPGERASWYYVRAESGWSHGFGEETAPTFAPLMPHALRQLTEARPRARQRLSELGVQYWDAPSTAPARVRLIADLVRDPTIASTATIALRKAYEDAWEQVVRSGEDNPLGGDTEAWIVASRRSRVVAISLDDAGSDEPIYVQDVDSSQALLLLEQQSALVMRLRRDVGRVVAELLAELGKERVRRLSDTDVTVHVDGRAFSPSGQGELLVDGRDWLVGLVTSLTELRSGRFRRVGIEAIRRTRDVLQRIRVVLAERVEASVDGQQVESKSGALALVDPVNPTIVLKRSELADEAQLLEVSAPAIAELIGYPDLDHSLRLSLIDLARQGHLAGEGPSLTAIAEAIGEPEERLREIAADASQLVIDLLQVLTPLIAVTDPRIASDLWTSADSFDSDSAVVDWLRQRLADADIDHVVSAARLDGLQAARLELGIELRDLNIAIAALGAPFEPLMNREGIAQAFDYFVRRHRDAILAALRARFVDAYRSLDSLDEYVARRELASLQPDPEWVDQYFDLDDDVIASRVNSWLGKCGAQLADADSAIWIPVDDLRRGNRAELHEMTMTARALVRAWEGSSGRAASGLPGDPEAIVELATSSGQLDFEPLSADRAIAWLDSVGLWPVEMPRSLDPNAVGVEQSAFDGARRKDEDAAQTRRQAERQVSIDDEQYEAGQENYAAIVDAVRAGITPALLATPAKVTELPDMSPTRGRSGGAGTGGVTAARQLRLSDVQRAAVGLAGEVVALEWLKANFDGATDASWRSGYRNLVLGGAEGDDSLGYDFEVLERRHRLLFEVKASATNVCEFDLTEGEIRAAQGLRRGDRYHILYVTHALTSDERSVHLLPNPLGTDGLGKYRTVGSGLRLRFKLE